MNQLTKKALPQPLKAYIFSPKRAVFLGICAVIFTTYLAVNLKTDKIYAATGINRTINFQGKVVNKDGTNVADGQYTFVFKLYDAASGGANPWTETQNNVQVTAGVFRVSLGSVTTFASANVDFNTDNLYLGINFSSDGEMTPRIRFAAVPYAINAQRVAGLTVTDTTGTLTIPNAKTVQFGGAFTTSAQDLTLTLSGATTLTLPTTGTLATLGGIESLSNKTFTTSIVTSGVTTDLTTVSNEDFSIVPNGTGKVLINTTAGLASFDVRQNAQNGGTIAVASVSGRTSFAALVADNSGLGDLFTASASGATRFRIASNGSIYGPNWEIQSTGSANMNAWEGGGLSSDCSAISSKLQWDASTKKFECTTEIAGGTPGSDTQLGTADLGNVTLANTATYLNTVSITPSTITGDIIVRALLWTRSLSSTDQTITVQIRVASGSTCAGSLLASGTSALNSAANANGPSAFAAYLDVNAGASLKSYAVCALSTVNSGAAAGGLATAEVNDSGTSDGASLFNISNGAMSPKIITPDFLWGGISTESAVFRITGNTSLSGVLPAASVSANTSFAAFVIDNRGVGDLLTASTAGVTRFTIAQNGVASSSAGFTVNGVGTIQSTRNQTLTIGGGSTGDLTLGRTTQRILLPGFDCSAQGGGGKLTTTTGGILTCSADTGGTNLWQAASNGTLAPGNLTVDTLFGGNSTASATFRISGSLDTGTVPAASVSANTSFAAFVIDNKGVGDLFTASTAGLTRFIIAQNGTASSSAGFTINGIGTFQSTRNQTLAIGGGSTGDIILGRASQRMTLPGFDCSGQVNGGKLTTTAGGILTCSQDSGGYSPFQETSGTIFANNSTLDVLLGANATASAALRVTGQANPFAGTSVGVALNANTSFASLVVSNAGLGDLFTASNAGVTRFAITRVGGFRLGTSEGNSGQCLTSGGAGSGASWGTCGGAGTWDVSTTLGVHYPGNNTLDLLVGGSSTQSASFSVLGIASGASPTASVSAQTGSNATKGLYMAGDGSLQSVRKNTLVIGGGTTGDIQFMPGNASTSLYLASNGSIRFNGSTGNAQDCLVSAGSSSAPVWGSCLTGTAGNFWNLNAAQGTTYSINTTLDLLWGGTTTNSAGFRVSGATKNFGTVAAASVSANTSFAGFVMDNRGSGDIFTASSAGQTRLTLFQNGNVTIGNSGNQGYKLDVQGSVRIGNNSTTDDIVKETTSDFTTAGTSITTSDGVNTVTTTGDKLQLVTDLIGAGASLTAPAAGQTTGTNVTTGSVAFQRPDRKFVVYVGGASTSRMYDASTNTWTAGPSTSAGVSLGAGSRAFQRQNGSVMILHGGATSTTVYQPGASQNMGTSSVGPVTTGTVGVGSQAIRMSNGKVHVVHGNTSTTTSVYDPTACVGVACNNTFGRFTAGPATTGNVTTGSFLIPRPDGKWILGLGGATTTNLFDPSSVPAFTAGPALTTGSPGAGTHVIQLPDGRFMVLIGGTGNTQIYDPISNTFSAGSTLATDTLGAGAHSFQRSDGKWIVVVGGNSKNLQLYDPTSGANGTFSQLTGASGLVGATNAGAGSLTFQRPDGMYVVVMGQTTQLTTIYDAGWNTTGTWTSEDINNTKISTYSAMMWNANPQSANNNARLDLETINFAVKTGDSLTSLGNNAYKSLQDSGDLIRSYGNAQYAKIQITFTVPVRSYPSGATGYINQTNIWEGDGGLFYRRSLIQPTVYSVRIQNPLVSYGDPTGAGDPAFGRNFATGSAVMEGVVTDNSNRLKLATLRNFPTATGSAGFIIASASADLGGNAGAGAHTLERNNGQFITILGNASTTTRIYDVDTNLWTGGPALPSAAGAGAHSFLLPDGRFFVILGNSTNATAIFDPQAGIFYAGPRLYGNVGIGSNSFQRSDGFFVILNGGATNLSNLLDPFTMSVSQGPFTTGATPNVGGGSMTIKRPDGRFLVILGNNNTAATGSNIYDQATNAFLAGPTVTTAITTGAAGVQLPNGRIIIARGGNGTVVWDPTLTTTAAGPAITANGAGSFWIPRSDGKALLATGANTTTTQVYDQTGNTVTATTTSPTLPCNVNTGGHVFQRQTGEYVVICGGGTASTAIIDAGWNMGGTYTSEQIQVPNLNASTSMYWKGAGEGSITIKYRTAASKVLLGVAAWKDMPQSGTALTTTTGDSWFQTRIDFQGALQDLPGSKTRVWLASDSGGGLVYYRSVQTPILNYWKLQNIQDPTLLTLSSGGASAFRFSSDGQAYTSEDGAWNSGGADLAERYSSLEKLEAGEVVSLDRLNSQHTQRSTRSYDANVMGVVSTQPGFVAGAFTENSYPIALVGRVPVKVSSENGIVRSGDYLTSASIPGYAMKATVGGRVLGQAMEDMAASSSASLIECPKYGAGNLSTTKCSTVTVFVNLTSFNGESVQVAMTRDGFKLSENELPLTAGIDFSYGTADRRQQEILGFLRQQRNNGQQIYTDSVAATTEVISPKIITDLLVAKKIKAESIEGLEIITNSIESLANKVATGSGIINFTEKLTSLSDSQQILDATMASISARLDKLGSVNLLGMVSQHNDGDFLTAVDNLAVYGTSTLGDVSILNSLTVGAGSTMTIGSHSIDTLGEDFSIQALKQGAVAFLGGLIRFETDGTAVFAENVSFKKDVSVTGVLSATTVAATDLLLGQGEATVLSDTEVESTAAAGLVTIKKENDHVRVINPLIRSASYIFITPKSATSRTLYLLEQKESRNEEKGYFIVGIDRPANDDIKFNYLVVN